MFKQYSAEAFNSKFCNIANIFDEEIVRSVKGICNAVKTSGDQAVIDYTKLYDQVDYQNQGFRVTEEEIVEAYQSIEDEWLQALRKAIANITSFHEQQKEKSWMDTSMIGTVRGQLVTPLQRVGLYVPGGTASLASSVLMCGIPPQIAGVEEIVITSPAAKDGRLPAQTLVAAAEIGIKEIYKIGGAQAIAALAYGTETIKKVDKIAGPGNIYVTIAKKEVFGIVDIDMLAGPSEVCVVADSSAKPEWVAADLLAQAEHDALARAILITTDAELADQVGREIEQQICELAREAIARQSIVENSGYVLVETIEEAVDLANQFAPEHLELAVDAPFDLLPFVKNAGSIFLGHFAAESIGDYAAGPNHVLPTGGSARFYSSLGVSHFYKRSGVLYMNRQGFDQIADTVIQMATGEALQGHADAVRRRK